MGSAESGSVAEAREILLGRPGRGPTQLLDLARRLQRAKAFGYARRIVALALVTEDLDPELERHLRHQHALTTYKDPDLPGAARLERALEILSGTDDLRTTRDQETLGLAGAIFKRKWDLQGQKQHLERALAYYVRGYRAGPTRDLGYTGINAAYLLDLLASLEEREAREAGLASEAAEARRGEARRIREELARELPALLDAPGGEALARSWWFLATVAEACFGLGRWEEAAAWLERAAALEDVPPWQYETTVSQLVSLARARVDEGSPSEDSDAFLASAPAQVLAGFVGQRAPGALSAFGGKVGLALSGGGFRASLFHIGVLARLAELDVLRHVEVLSCVSGGAIVGAHYYLEVRRLLQDKADAEVTREDYIGIVQRMERDFLAGVQRNVRARVAAELITNLKMIFLPHYSRTERVGELYEKLIYSRVEDGEGKGPRWLTDLFVHPKGEAPGFAPKHDNWRRRNKVPILILNATTLNTGHNWQFTASWMGEPPGAIDPDVDGNYRLRRMYYHEAPEKYRRFRLGRAVATSSCVPGLFEPIALPGLYPDRTVQLVDGGVHDNQGVVGLLEQDCTALLVSDASGQMGALDEPRRGFLSVLLRANSILGARVREAQLHDLLARRRASLLRGLMVVHLKKGLDVEPVDWIGCQDPPDLSLRPTTLMDEDGRLTPYGVRKDVQQRLAAVRTDLDSFCDAEAFALMASGYRMATREFDEAVRGIPVSREARPEWRFLRVDPALRAPEGTNRAFLRLLDVSTSRTLKVWKLSRPLQVVGWVLTAVILAALGWATWTWREHALLTVGGVGGAVVATVGVAILGRTIMQAVRFRDTATRVAIGAGMALFGWLLARIHLHLFDRLYLRVGRVERVVRTRRGAPDEAGARARARATQAT